MEKDPTPAPTDSGTTPSQPAPTATPRPAAPTATPTPPPGFDAAEYFRGKTGVAGEQPGWIGRAELQAATKENEDLLEGSQVVIEEQKARLLPKFFSEYVS